MQKYRNSEIQKFNIFGNLKSPQKSGPFDTRRSPVALFVPEIWPEIQKKYRNTEIQKYKNLKINSFLGNLKSPKKSGRFDTCGSPVALFVPEI